MFSNDGTPTPPGRILSSIAIALLVLEAIVLESRARLPRNETNAPIPRGFFTRRAWTAVLLGAICISFDFELGLCVQCQFQICLIIIVSAGFYPARHNMRGTAIVGVMILLYGWETICIFVWYRPLRRSLDYGERISGIIVLVPILTAIITLPWLAYALFDMYRTIKRTRQGDPSLLFIYGVGVVGETLLLTAYGLEFDRTLGPAAVSICTMTASCMVILIATHVYVALKKWVREWPTTQLQAKEEEVALSEQVVGVERNIVREVNDN